MNPTKQTKYYSAFSLIELLIVVASIGVLASVAIFTIGGTKQSLSESKLDQDVSRLNSAVKIFLSSGGTLEGTTSAQDVLTELKKEASAATKRRIVGNRGSMIDPRLEASTGTDGKLHDRAVWRSAENRFVIEQSTSGVREFRMNEELGLVDYGSADRQTRLLYNGEDGWVWEVADSKFEASNGPSEVPELTTGTLGAGSGAGANSSRLNPPTIAPNSGFHALALFPLTVTLTKHSEDPDDVTILYSLGDNSWTVYIAPFAVAPNTTVHAYTTHRDPSWGESEKETGSFLTNPAAIEVALFTPINPITYAEAGGELMPGDYTPPPALEPIMVTLPNGYTIPDIYENSDKFQYYWTYDGSDPLGSSSRYKGITFTNGYKNNNGHGNNYSGVDITNPNWKQKAAQLGWTQEEIDAFELAASDDEMKPFDRIAYTIDYWEGASLLPIRVVAKSKNPEFVTNSIVMTSNISINRTNLRKPHTEMPEDPRRGDIVELTLDLDYGDMPAGARIYYTTDGSDPGIDQNGNPLRGTLYTGSFDPLLGRGTMEGEVMIISRVYPPENYPEWFNVSQPESSLYLVPTWELTGEGVAGFDSNGELVSQRNDYSSGSYFEWTDPSNGDVSMFTDVSNRERFQIGQLSYYNGSGYAAGDVGSFGFSVELDLLGSTERFDFQLNQFVTYNNDSEWDSADVISFEDTVSAHRVNLFGTEYLLSLEFGNSTSNSATIGNEFQVQEGALGIADLYGTLIAPASWWTSGAPAE